MRFASSFDAVTVDAFGTLLLLGDPAEPLRAELADRGIERTADEVRDAFRAEARYYRPRSLRGRDATGLASLRADCVAVFLAELGADLDPPSFVDAFMRSIAFRLADGAEDALAALAGAGLSLACVANWDVSLHAHLAAAGVDRCFAVVQSSAEAGFEKPDPRIFEVALERLGVEPGRALHIGDEDVDRDGAAAAGMAFEPVPLATLPSRLGL
jgi:putative hydrolase of the HAD superfamily